MVGYGQLINSQLPESLVQSDPPVNKSSYNGRKEAESFTGICVVSRLPLGSGHEIVVLGLLWQYGGRQVAPLKECTSTSG